MSSHFAHHEISRERVADLLREAERTRVARSARRTSPNSAESPSADGHRHTAAWQSMALVPVPWLRATS